MHYQHVQTITINTNEAGDTISVSSPYHPDFPAKARSLGGKWSPSSRVWTFDQRDEQRVRDLCKKIFGTDGSAAGGDLVTVRLTIPEREVAAGLLRLTSSRTDWGNHYLNAWFGGREIASCKNGDEWWSGENVVCVEGDLEQCDSDCPAGVTLEIRDLPRAVVEQEIEQYQVRVADALRENAEEIEEQVVACKDEIEELDAQLADLEVDPSAEWVSDEDYLAPIYRHPYNDILGVLLPPKRSKVGMSKWDIIRNDAEYVRRIREEYAHLRPWRRGYSGEQAQWKWKAIPALGSSQRSRRKWGDRRTVPATPDGRIRLPEYLEYVMRKIDEREGLLQEIKRLRLQKRRFKARVTKATAGVIEVVGDEPEPSSASRTDSISEPADILYGATGGGVGV